ncbi:Na(+) H(+) antiporter subunit E [hydrothermal vent metagenome]|uniref:Na(+) H(+) antiporter subunit E n=1 Tax=hydrothermal vent metagenome TaxID=652676 RepID=A0A1W1BN85_9ZZZZ
MRFIFWSIMLFIIWIILTGSVEIANILVGIILSVGTTLLYLNMFEEKKEFEFINPFWLLVYIYVLIKNIIKSNIYLSKILARKDLNLTPAIVAVPTKLDSDWKKLLLANSITLTPGTLTLDIKEDMLFIHIIEYEKGTDKLEITREFEKVIKNI